ncbi:exodeoxyribonuclease VII small subunit [Desulfofalx alkaliphila]|uniref:exodeoxyribonuclease VII small subunit n=1 Tax=Desulfofalx alkaliphila TaxID=105483 RepID=UPI0004E0C9D0|nr:exodeoxyribonuclease VII small subunit [Desulfofalx alkaliphila]
MQEKQKELTFEEALARLEVVVKQLEDGQLPLEESLALYAEGIELVKVCNHKLDNAEEHIRVLLADDKGELMLKELQQAKGEG